MKPYLERMIKEAEDLNDKITKGRAAIDNMNLDMSNYERLLLSKQMSYYEQALATLELRITIAKEKEGEE